MKFGKLKQSKRIEELTLNEIVTLPSLKHENIITLNEIYREKGKMYLVYEYCRNGTLE